MLSPIGIISKPSRKYDIYTLFNNVMIMMSEVYKNYNQLYCITCILLTNYIADPTHQWMKIVIFSKFDLYLACIMYVQV